MKSLLNKNSINLLFFTLFTFVSGLAIFMRLFNPLSTMQWLDDSARDVIIAKEISETGSFVDIRPMSGTIPGIKNSPFYYNSLALLWSFTKSFPDFLFVYTLIQTTTLIFGFFIGKEIGGRWLGLLVFAFLATSEPLSIIQHSVYQRYITPGLALAIIYFGIIAAKKNTLFSILTLNVTLTSAVLFHNSLFMFALPVFLLNVQFLIKKIKNKSPFSITLYVVSSVMCLLTWVLSSGINYQDLLSIHDQLVSFRTSEYQFDLDNYFYFYFNQYKDLGKIISLISLAFSPIIIFHARKHSAIKTFFLFYLNFIFSLLIFAILRLSALSESWSHVYSIGIVLPSIPISFFLVVTFLYKSEKKRVLIIGFSGFLLSLSSTLTIRSMVQKNRYGHLGEYETLSNIAKVIKSDSFTMSGNTSVPFVIDHSDYSYLPGWFSTSLLYFFQDSTDQKLVSLRTNGNNLTYHFNTKTDYYYLLCHNIYDNSIQDSNIRITDHCFSRMSAINENLLTKELALPFLPKESKTTLLLDSQEIGLEMVLYRVEKVPLL